MSTIIYVWRRALCGLIGMAGDISYQLRNLFRDFLDVCQVRGRDSTGVVRVNKDLDYNWAKQVGPPSFLCDTKEYDKLMTGDCMVLIGHTRSKTSGEVTRRNAHPFDYPDQGIIGVHNGTLRGHHNLDGYQYQKVDSDVLYGHLALNGAQETFNKIQGAYACVWWDNNEKTLNFIRNNERPLWFTWTKDKKVMLWASEIWMFSALSRKIELWEGEKDEDNKVVTSPFYQLPVDAWWRFRPEPKPTAGGSYIVMRPILVIEKPKPQVSVRPVNNGWRETSGGAWVRENENGGEVTNPFYQARETLLARMLAAQDSGDPIDDDLPWELGEYPGLGGFELAMALDDEREANRKKASNDEVKPPKGIRPVETNSPLSNVSFLKDSLAQRGCSTGSTSTKQSSRNVLSLREKTSRDCPSSSNGEPCGGSALLSRRLHRLNGVSFRTVAGLNYITQNSTGTEWSEVEFAHATGGECSFCHNKVDNLKEVGTILGKDSFICKSCLKEPAQVA